jgi:hypothetical protein
MWTEIKRQQNIVKISLRERSYIWKRVYIRAMLDNNKNSFSNEEFEKCKIMIQSFDESIADLLLEIIITKFNINV